MSYEKKNHFFLSSLFTVLVQMRARFAPGQKFRLCLLWEKTNSKTEFLRGTLIMNWNLRSENSVIWGGWMLWNFLIRNGRYLTDISIEKPAAENMSTLRLQDAFSKNSLMNFSDCIISLWKETKGTRKNYMRNVEMRQIYLSYAESLV